MSKASKEEKGEAAAVDPAVKNAIGNKLKSLYDEVVQEPVPDRFTELLKKLDTDNR